MADSNSPAPGVRCLFDIASDLESNQDCLRILLDMTTSIACDWHTTDNTEVVGRIIERVTVLSNLATDKITELNGLVQDVYEHHKAGKLLAE